ncbi:protein kinase [Purpureocillium lavendulum]|uniref:Protein kinase n=1 Tax=Purpureocillium lavendulum TaxID=1247861 RepID=A0AB34FF22_9HYPO|nr:protein kinase [Purpureocillium lavendulum]
MLRTLRKQLAKQPDMFRFEMIAFLSELFDVEVSKATITRALQSSGMTRKIIRRVAMQQDTDLHDLFLHKIHLQQVKSYHMTFVDESGSDKREGHRRWGWADEDVTPVQRQEFSRGRRFQVLPAYTQDGILLSRIYPESTNSAIFEDFIEQLIQHCGRFPEPRSALIWDNASWHRTTRVNEMCAEAGVKNIPSPPYSPRFNPIEEFFAEFKDYVKKHWYEHLFLIRRDFRAYLRNCIDAAGYDRESARGHFCHSGYHVYERYERYRNGA